MSGYRDTPKSDLLWPFKLSLIILKEKGGLPHCFRSDEKQCTPLDSLSYHFVSRTGRS